MTQEEIFRQYHDRIQHYILGKVSDYYIAEDLTSTVFLKISQKLQDYDESKASISTWIYTIANNTVIDFYRTNKTYEEVPEDIAVNGEPDEEILRSEQLTELADALRQLTERERDIIILHFYHNRTLKEIALTMGMSYGNVKVVQQKALMKLRGLIRISD